MQEQVPVRVPMVIVKTHNDVEHSESEGQCLQSQGLLGL